MRKLTILLLLLVSFLNALGEPDGFTYENAVKAITQLKNKKPIVLEQANNSKQIQQNDKDKAESILTSTFEKLDKVMSIYNQIEEDPALKLEAQRLVGDFLDAYSNAILDNDKESIEVTTRRFITVAEEYTPKFDAFYDKAQEYIVTHPKEGCIKEETEESVENTDVSLVAEERESNAKDSNSTSSLWIFISLISLIASLISMVMSVCALRRIKDEHVRIGKRKQKIEDVEKRLKNEIDNILKSNSYSRSSSSYSPPTPPLIREPRHPLPPSEAGKDKQIEGSKVNNSPSPSYLYASIKAQSPFAEFFKVANENSGDKVFMITLEHPDDVVAKFTIAPNMSPDFLKSIIVDRDTYLPLLFCEKSIDSSNPTEIKVVSDGSAKKVDGKWVVQERMSIRLV